MAEAPPLDFDAFVARKKSEPKDPAAPDGREYAYSFDRKTRETFERMRPVQIVVEKTVTMFKSAWRNQLLGSAVKVSDRQFPRIQRIAERCAQTLNIATPTVYVVNNPYLNAGTYGTNEESFILVNSALVDHYSDEELLTVIGHECGHVHNGHVVYLTALHYLVTVAGVFLAWVAQPALIALKTWSRRAEITSDRAGMLCAKDPATAAERALTKLALGSRKLYEEFNLDAFLEQHQEGREGIGKYMEVFASHPWLPKRVLAMREFAKSALYRSAVGLEGGAPMSEVDERVAALLKGDA